MYEELAGQTVPVTFDRHGHATISGDGLATLTVEPIFEEADVMVVAGLTWPPMFAWRLVDGRALATKLDATIGRAEETERLVRVYWCLTLPAGDLLFADLGHVMRYARQVTRMDISDLFTTADRADDPTTKGS